MRDEHLVKALTLAVDKGEAEPITLSIERDLILLTEDLRGRRVAERMGVRYIGTLGLLKIAKNRRIIDETKQYILKFLESGYYIDQKLIEKFLKDVGEIEVSYLSNSNYLGLLPFTSYNLLSGHL